VKTEKESKRARKKMQDYHFFIQIYKQRSDF